MHHRRRVLSAVLLGAFALLRPADGHAQAWSYPSFQLPRVTGRELNFGLADADPGTSLLFQWREGRTARSQLSLDVGFVDDAFGGPRSEEVFFVGGQYAHQLATQTAEMPFDFLLTVGVNAAFSDPANVFRIPVGVSIGHRFPLEGGMMAITPWVHPRISIDHCGDCIDETDANFYLDLGGDLEFSPRFSIRLAATVGGSDFLDDAFGVSLAWRPGGSRAPVARPPRRG